MRPRVLALVVLLLFALPSLSQQAPSQAPAAPVSPVRDPQALSLLQASIKAMGGAAPTDSTAAGTITITAGGKTDEGSIQILTRGTNETLEEASTSGVHRVAFCHGSASEYDGTTTQRLSLQAAASSQSPDFPLPFFEGALANPDSTLQFVGLESTGGATANHIRIWNTYSSKPHLQAIAPFTVKDIWLDAVTGLPRRISYDSKRAAGAVPVIHIDVELANYQRFGAVLYPTLIKQSLNGTLWKTVAIQSVTFNNGLTESNFPIQ